MGNALFEPILQCVSRCTATRLILLLSLISSVSCYVSCRWTERLRDDLLGAREAGRMTSFHRCCRLFVIDAERKVVAPPTGERLRAGLRQLWRAVGGRRRLSAATPPRRLLRARLSLGRPVRRHRHRRHRLQLDGDDHRRRRASGQPPRPGRSRRGRGGGAGGPTGAAGVSATSTDLPVGGHDGARPLHRADGLRRRAVPSSLRQLDRPRQLLSVRTTRGMLQRVYTVSQKLFTFLLLARLPHSVGGQTSNGRWRLSSSVTLHGGPAGGFTRVGQAMTSCRLQSNYSSTVTLHGGPVVLRPVRATPCFFK